MYLLTTSFQHETCLLLQYISIISWQRWIYFICNESWNLKSHKKVLVLLEIIKCRYYLSDLSELSSLLSKSSPYHIFSDSAQKIHSDKNLYKNWIKLTFMFSSPWKINVDCIQRLLSIADSYFWNKPYYFLWQNWCSLKLNFLVEI